MQIPQIAYSTFPASAFAGQVADLKVSDTVSGLAETALDCGRFLTRGTNPNQVKLPASGANVTNALRGVSIFQSIKEPIPGSALHFKATDAVNVLRVGRIWVLVVDVDVPTDLVPFIKISGADAGLIRGTADASAQVAPGGVKVVQGAAVGGLALVELNLN